MNISDYLKYLSRKQKISLLSSDSETERELSDEWLSYKLEQFLKESTLSTSQKRKIWQMAMQGLFLSEMQRCFLFTPTSQYTKTSSLKNAITKILTELKKELDVSFSPIYVSKINDNPLQFTVSLALVDVKNFEEFFEIDLSTQFVFYVFPELGLVSLWPLDKDMRLKTALNIINELFNDAKEIKVNALLLRKFSTNEKMHHLVISTPPEIAGFSGLDTIEFKGSDVMLGLSGLKRRHDAEVEKITRVGPLTFIDSENLTLKAGKGVRFKNYNAINKFLRVIKS